MIIIAYTKESAENEVMVIKIEQPIDKNAESNGIVSTQFVSDTHVNPPDVVMHCHKTSVPKTMFFDEFIDCFSVRKNLEILTSVKKPANAVPIIDGLKYD